MFRAFKSASNLTSLINILHNQVYHSTYSVHLHLSPHTSTLFLFAVGSSFAEVFLPVRLTVQFIVFCLQYIWFARNTLCKFNYYHYFLLYMLYIHIIKACVIQINMLNILFMCQKTRVSYQISFGIPSTTLHLIK